MNKHILKVNEKDFNEALNDWLDGNDNANILGFKKFFFEYDINPFEVGIVPKIGQGCIKKYVAGDNTDGNFWVEEFYNLKDCINWLNDQY